MQKPVSTRKAEPQSAWKLLYNFRLCSFILICFILSIAMSINFTFLPIYFKMLHYPLGWVGANFTVAALVEVPLFQIADKIMARIGHRRTFVIGTLAYTSKYVLMALAPGAAWVILIQVLDGIGFSMYWSAAVHMVQDLAPEGRLASAQTLFGACSSLSGIIGFSVGGWLIQQFGPTTMYGTMAGIDFVAFLAFLIFAWLTRSQLTPSQHVSGTP